MLTLVGTYINGYLKLDKEYTMEKPVKVIDINRLFIFKK